MNIFTYIKNNDIENIKNLINKDKKVLKQRRTSYYQTPLHYACRLGNKEIAELLIKAGADVNVKDKYGDTPLHIACSNKYTEIVELLTKYHANVNAKNKSSNTPLHLAHKKEIVKLLIQAGADVNVKNNNDKTPLYIASEAIWNTDNIDIIELLIQAGANIKDINLYDFFEKRNKCYTNGLKKEFDSVIKLLIKHGARITNDIKRDFAKELEPLVKISATEKIFNNLKHTFGKIPERPVTKI